MLTIDLEDFTIELKDGTIKHVGSSTTKAEVKLYDVTDVSARTFGDRTKLAFEDDEGNAIEIALDDSDVRSIATALEELE